VAYEGNQAGDVTWDQIVLARSTDGGHTFTNVELGRVHDDVGCYPLNVAQGRQRLSFEQFRINGFPSLAIDPTTGGLAIAWADDQNNAGCANGATKFSGVLDLVARHLRRRYDVDGPETDHLGRQRQGLPGSPSQCRAG